MRSDEFIAFALDGATRMQQLINDLLAYSRVGTQRRAFEPVDMGALVDQVVADLGQLMNENQARVTRDALPTVAADARQLSQVFQNLITNVIRYRREEPPRIHVSAHASGSTWQFSVADNGVGIDPQYHERIFLLFPTPADARALGGDGSGASHLQEDYRRSWWHHLAGVHAGRGQQLHFHPAGAGCGLMLIQLKGTRDCSVHLRS